MHFWRENVSLSVLLAGLALDKDSEYTDTANTMCYSYVLPTVSARVLRLYRDQRPERCRQTEILQDICRIQANRCHSPGECEPTQP